MAERLDSLILRLDQYILCETAITTGSQDYTIGSRKLTRANLKEISDMIQYLEREVGIEKSKAANKVEIEWLAMFRGIFRKE